MLCVRNVRVCQFGDVFSWFNIKTGHDFMHIPFRSDGESGLFNILQFLILSFYWLWTTYIMSLCVLCVSLLQMSKCVKLWCLQQSLQLWMPSFFKWWLWFGVGVKLSASSFSLLLFFQDTLRECHPSDEHCLPYLPWVSPIYFVTFVLMAQFVLVNVVVAVLMKHLEESNKVQ